MVSVPKNQQVPKDGVCIQICAQVCIQVSTRSLPKRFGVSGASQHFVPSAISMLLQTVAPIVASVCVNLCLVFMMVRNMWAALQ